MYLSLFLPLVSPSTDLFQIVSSKPQKTKNLDQEKVNEKMLPLHTCTDWLKMCRC